MLTEEKINELLLANIAELKEMKNKVNKNIYEKIKFINISNKIQILLLILEKDIVEEYNKILKND